MLLDAVLECAVADAARNALGHEVMAAISLDWEHQLRSRSGPLWKEHIG